MSRPSLSIDFVSDVVCPWCAIGLASLNQALQRLDGEVTAQLRFQPFELNPQMAAEGEDIVEHLARKYGRTPQQVAEGQAMIAARGEQVGFHFDLAARSRVVNTFDAHRLLHWAETLGRQAELKQALLEAYFSQGRDVSQQRELLAVVDRLGLDRAAASAVLNSDAYAAEVREAERFWQTQGIQSVPSIVVNQRYLIQGGQPVEVFEQMLRQIAQEAAAA